MGGEAAFSDSDTLNRVSPSFNLVGIVLVAIVGVSLAFGITAGVIGWFAKTMELDALVEQKASIDGELALLRNEAGALAMRR